MYFPDLRRALFAGAVIAGGLGAAGAQAQETEPGVPIADQADDSVILVTAQRRDQRLIDVPATISVVGGEELAAASIANTRELGQLVPGLQISNFGAFTSVAIRGLSSETGGPGAENNAAIYLDGLYLPSKSAGVFDFPDVQSIEVLKGPQGTLYGRNATGGAILINTIKPSFTPTGNISASYGSFNDREFKATVSTGLVPDVLAASISAYHRENDGYLRSAVTGDRIGGVKSTLIRGKLLFVPSDSVEMTLSGYYSKRTDRDTMAFTIPNGNTNGVLFDPEAIIGTDHGFNGANNPNIYRNETFGVSLRTDIQTGIGKLSVIAGYMDLDAYVLTDGDNSSATGIDYLTIQPQQTFSAETFLASEQFGAVSFLVGASYYNDVGKFEPVRIFVGGAPILDIFAKVKTEALAVYAEANVELTDRLTIIAGARWTTEEKEHFGAYDSDAYPFVGKKRWNNLTPRAVVQYAPNPDTKLYASYSKGFKSGQFNPTAFFAEKSVDPETVDAFEVGVKARLGGGFDMNLSAFHYSYKNIQVATFRANAQVLQNAARARIYGADIDFSYRPITDLSFSAAASLLNTKYLEFTDAVILAPIPSALCPAGLAFCGNQNVLADLSGNRLPRAPQFTARGSINYTLRADRHSFDFFANLYYSSKFFWDASNRLSQDDYAVLNASVSWHVNDGPLTLQLWGQNLTNTAYYNSQGIGLDADGLLSAPPRAVGGRVIFRF